VPRLALILDKLEAFHGRQEPGWPTDPYLFLIWWHCGYPASDASCVKGWESLHRVIGVDPNRLLAADLPDLARALKPGGMVPELRALRLKEIAARIQREFGGDLRAFQGMTPAQVRAALKKFPNIVDPGADRILLLADFRRSPRSLRTFSMSWCASLREMSVRTTAGPTAKLSR
jgi:endonuclease III